MQALDENDKLVQNLLERAQHSHLPNLSKLLSSATKQKVQPSTSKQPLISKPAPNRESLELKQHMLDQQQLLTFQNQFTHEELVRQIKYMHMQMEMAQKAPMFAVPQIQKPQPGQSPQKSPMRNKVAFDTAAAHSTLDEFTRKRKEFCSKLEALQFEVKVPSIEIQVEEEELAEFSNVGQKLRQALFSKSLPIPRKLPVFTKPQQSKKKLAQTQTLAEKVDASVQVQSDDMLLRREIDARMKKLQEQRSLKSIPVPVPSAKQVPEPVKFEEPVPVEPLPKQLSPKEDVKKATLKVLNEKMIQTSPQNSNSNKSKTNSSLATLSTVLSEGEVISDMFSEGQVVFGRVAMLPEVPQSESSFQQEPEQSFDEQVNSPIKPDEVNFDTTVDIQKNQSSDIEFPEVRNISSESEPGELFYEASEQL